MIEEKPATMTYKAASKKGRTMAKKKVFSVTKAVKANARERVGQPKPARVINDQPRSERKAAKHKATLREILNSTE